MPDGGSGGMPDGGSGGGGSGGEPTGGSGGMPDGGSGGMGAGGAEQVALDLQLNEIHPQYVEIFFLDRVESSYNLDEFRIVVDGDVPNACNLMGGVVDGANLYFVAQRAAAPCLSGAACVTDCTFASIGTSSEVRLEMLINGSYEQIDLEITSSTALSGGESYQASPDGSDNFIRASVSPGASNN
jgi:hypothetical protein